MNLEINEDNKLNEVFDNIDEENLSVPYCDEENILEATEDDFEYQIKERGKNYYNSGNILKVCKTGNKYYAKVRGSAEIPYNVIIDNSDEYEISYECDCPYDYPCKHEYAVLMAISNQEYEIVEIKQEIREKKCSLQSLIEKIPANEIKDYLLSSNGLDYVCFEMGKFEEHFRKYLPKQKYEFYYNNLYNELILNSDNTSLTHYFINKAKQYIDNNDFAEGYKIIKSIIEAYRDSKKINCSDSLIDLLPKIGMLLRVSYRKCDTTTKETIDKWVTKLKDNNYYDNYYLEDIIVLL